MAFSLRCRISALVLYVLGSLAVSQAQTTTLAPTQTYFCDPTKCLAPDCHCPSWNAPLPVAQMPQFVLLTHDDSTGPESVGLVNQTTAGFKNPNGCNIPFTFFTMHDGTVCSDATTAWQAGHEIATHTWSHMSMPPGFTGGLGSTSKEIINQRQWLIDNCSLPAADVVGFRAPYLFHNPPYRQALVDGGFLYDSSINEHYPMLTSPNGGQRLWPYTMDFGIPQDCAWISGDSCAANESHPGLWEVPAWVVQTDTYPDPAYAMDYCTGESGKCVVAPFLEQFFKQSYNGNKAPVPFYIHSPWLSDNLPQSRAFIQWVTTNYPNDTYFVTMHQLVQWMKNPVPKDQMNAWLGCGIPGGNAAGAVGGGAAAAPPPVPTTAAAPSPDASAAAAQSPPPPDPAVIPAEPKSDPSAVASPPPPVPASSAVGGGGSRSCRSVMAIATAAAVVSLMLLF